MKSQPAKSTTKTQKKIPITPSVKERMIDNSKIPELKSYINAIIELFNKQYETIICQAEEIEELYSQHYNDPIIKQLQVEIKQLKDNKSKEFDFNCTADEWNKIWAWTNKHTKEKHWDSVCDCPTSSGTIGGRYSYEFTPTSIGTIGVVKCTCGDEFTFRNL